MSTQFPPLFHTWTKGQKLKLSNNFSASEFECNCGCTDQKIAVEIVKKFQKIRDALQLPIKIHSAYRCQKKQDSLTNKGYPTVKNSQHLLGNAVDVSCSNMPLFLSVLETEFKAIGVADTFYHVDTRTDKYRRWKY